MTAMSSDWLQKHLLQVAIPPFHEDIVALRLCLLNDFHLGIRAQPRNLVER